LHSWPGNQLVALNAAPFLGFHDEDTRAFRTSSAIALRFLKISMAPALDLTNRIPGSSGRFVLFGLDAETTLGFANPLPTGICKFGVTAEVPSSTQ
jgi:hypothetical protein